MRDYAGHYPATSRDERQQVMDCFAPGDLPALHELARHFAVCDHWFSSVPGPTWANRFFAHSGTSKGRVRMPEGIVDSVEHPSNYFDYDQDTIYDRLDERGRTWRIYHGDIPQSLVLVHQQTSENASRYSHMWNFEGDAAGPEADFPEYCFIEPSYYWPGQNDDHPPHATLPAQQLVADVYNAIRRNEALWKSTLLVVLYDEHGGFYDHVPPPETVSPDGLAEPGLAFDFARLGVRVPAILVSPWVNRTVVKDELDHTSLLKHLIEKWGLRTLTKRVDSARNFPSTVWTSGEAREDTPPALEVPHHLYAAAPEGQAGAAPPEELNPQQKALIAFSEHLERERIVEPVGKPVLMAAGPSSQAEVAKSRVKLFLAQQKLKAGPTG